MKISVDLKKSQLVPASSPNQRYDQRDPSMPLVLQAQLAKIAAWKATCLALADKLAVDGDRLVKYCAGPANIDAGQLVSRLVALINAVIAAILGPTTGETLHSSMIAVNEP